MDSANLGIHLGIAKNGKGKERGKKGMLEGLLGCGSFFRIISYVIKEIIITMKEKMKQIKKKQKKKSNKDTATSERSNQQTRSP